VAWSHLPDTDASYIAQASARIVRMFQRYAWNVDPESEHFLAFITQYLVERNVKNPTAIPYSELYKHIKNGIREYLRLLESSNKAKVPDKKGG
jgi:hypothetical protein